MEPWLADRGVTVVREHGRLDGERRVRAGDETLVARRAVVVATGTDRAAPADRRPARGEAVDQPRGDHREARCPSGWSILGGGVVGVEMAQA